MKQFNVKWSQLYMAYAIYFENKIVHGYDSDNKKVLESMAGRFQKEYSDTGHVSELGI